MLSKSVLFGLLPAAAIAALVLSPLEVVTEAQQPTPAGAAPAAGRGGGRGGPPTRQPSALRAIPAETTAAKAKDPELESAAHRVGASGSRWRLDERRHARHSDVAAGGDGHARVTHA